jgi:hypothetical protein
MPGASEAETASGRNDESAQTKRFHGILVFILHALPSGDPSDKLSNDEEF